MCAGGEIIDGKGSEGGEKKEGDWTGTGTGDVRGRSGNCDKNDGRQRSAAQRSAAQRSHAYLPTYLRTVPTYAIRSVASSQIDSEERREGKVTAGLSVAYLGVLGTVP